MSAKATLEVAVSSLSLLDEETDECAICMHAVGSETAVLKSCRHLFCRGCILTWAKIKRSCPLCNAAFEELLIVSITDNTSSEEFVPEPDNKPEADIARDLECLDHSYFINECRSLLSTAISAQRQLIPPGQKYSRFGYRSLDVWEEKKWRMLDNVIPRLETFVALFTSDDQFDPHQSLQDLYDIQDQMRVLWNDPRSYQLEEEPEYEDEEDYDEDEEDDSDERYYYGNKAKFTASAKKTIQSNAKINNKPRGRGKH